MQRQLPKTGLPRRDSIVSEFVEYPEKLVDGGLEPPVAAMPQGIWRIDTLTNLADIRKHAHAWLALEQDSIDPHAAFQSYVWCESWVATFCRSPNKGSKPRGPRPRVFFISRGDDLLAILPMMISTHMGARVLTLLGEPHSQIANAITKAGVDCKDGLRLCVAQAAMLTDADVVALGPLPADSELAKALENEQLSPDPADAMSLVTWPGIWKSADYLTSLSKNRRKDFHRKQRQLEDLGSVLFERHDSRSAEFKPLVREAVALKRQWLARNGMVSVGLSTVGVDDFLAGFTAREGGFEPEVEVLKINARPAAICINMVGRGVRHCYLSTYDNAFAQVSPGTLIHQLSIQESIDDGAIAYNFLGYPTHFKNLRASEHIELVRYQNALTLRGEIWLTAWIGVLRPAAKLIVTRLRGLAKMPALSKVMTKVVSRLSSKGPRR